MSRFTADEISKKITQLVSPKPNGWTGEIEIIFQFDRASAQRAAQPHGRLVFHRQVSDARRLPGREPGLRELFRKSRGEKLLNNHHGYTEHTEK